MRSRRPKSTNSGARWSLTRMWRLLVSSNSRRSSVGWARHARRAVGIGTRGSMCGAACVASIVGVTSRTHSATCTRTMTCGSRSLRHQWPETSAPLCPAWTAALTRTGIVRSRPSRRGSWRLHIGRCLWTCRGGTWSMHARSSRGPGSETAGCGWCSMYHKRPNHTLRRTAARSWFSVPTAGCAAGDHHVRPTEDAR